MNGKPFCQLNEEIKEMWDLHERLSVLNQDRNGNFSGRGTECMTRRIIWCITGLIDTSSGCWVLWWCGGGVTHCLFFCLTFAFIAMILIESNVKKTKFTLLLILRSHEVFLHSFNRYYEWTEDYPTLRLTWNQIFTCRERNVKNKTSVQL